jgi:hypothetical protein
MKFLRIPLEAFHGRHNNGEGLNHRVFHQYQIELLEGERDKREKICCYQTM